MGEKKIENFQEQCSPKLSSHEIEQAFELFNSMKSSLEGLDETLSRAESLVKVIEGISSKTDLLALNASIEAARAGQAGKGFAVVADDVSKLSEKTQSSIEEVKEVLTTIQKSLEKVGLDVEKGQKTYKKLEIVK